MSVVIPARMASPAFVVHCGEVDGSEDKRPEALQEIHVSTSCIDNLINLPDLASLRCQQGVVALTDIPGFCPSSVT
jgi:hypothetical protein